jgi:hypothetical protein
MTPRTWTTRRVQHIARSFHDHVCPECLGVWTHEDPHCVLDEGEELLDPACESVVAAGLSMNDDPTIPSEDHTDADFDTACDPGDEDAPRTRDDATGFYR